MARIIVTGSTGLLGSSLVPYLKNCNHEVVSVSSRNVCDINADLTSLSQVKSAFRTINADTIINLAALADVDLCEKNPQLAYLLNAKIVDNLSSWIKCENINCHMIQISTDQVYDGKGPHKENEVSIKNQYAMSKIAGEIAAKRSSCTVLRTNFVGKSHCPTRKSLTDWLYCELKNEKQIDTFSDVYFSPLSIFTVCKTIERCIVKKPKGIFNLGSREGMSKSKFAYIFAESMGFQKNLMTPTSYREAGQFTPRPSDMRMNSSLIERELSFELPELENEIIRICREYR